ncbi:MAG: flagellar protein FliS [Lachnospiraceae bacterium]|nr:flagellar protein FliS [Lachnospiraceae bacterium]
MTKESKQEYTLRISNANRSELVVIVYEMLLDYIEESIDHLEKQEYDPFHESIRKAVNCIRELSDSINYEADTAGNLFSLNVYCIKELSAADIHRDKDRIDAAKKIIKKLYEASKEAAKIDDSSPVMNNSQSVYAGLTYGKESLTVNLNDTQNRGFTI